MIIYRYIYTCGHVSHIGLNRSILGVEIESVQLSNVKKAVIRANIPNGEVATTEGEVATSLPLSGVGVSGLGVLHLKQCDFEPKQKALHFGQVQSGFLIH